MKLATVKIGNGDVEVLKQILEVLDLMVLEEEKEVPNLALSLQQIVHDFEEALGE